MTEVLLSAGRLLLVAVFVVAATAKLLDREGTRQAVLEFGAPRALVGPFAIALPLVELAVAALLIPPATAAAGAVGALVLLAAFSTAIAVSLARGRAPDCHCFGRLHSAPAGPATLARNGALAAVAAFTLVGSLAEPGTGIFEWAYGLSGTEALAVGLGLALPLVVGAGLAAFLTLLRSYGQVLVRVERLEAALGDAGLELGEPNAAPALGLEPGTPAPAFALEETRGGETVALDDLLRRRLPLLLVFASPGCGPCEALMPDLASWQQAHGERLSVAVLGDGAPEELRAEAERHEVGNVLADADGRLYRAYEAAGTPSAVLVAPEATISSRIAAGPAAIAELVAGVLDAPGLPVGAPAPALDHLSALDGRTVNLGDGRESLVLFWNPDCGFCRSMHADLLAWEAGANGSSPRLVVVSSGAEERTRGDRFRAPVLLDPDWSASGAFGASGTPSAVLVDSEGRVDSEILVGAEAILARTRGPQLVHMGMS